MQQVLINLNIVAQTGLEYDAILNRQPHEEYGNFTKMGIFSEISLKWLEILAEHPLFHYAKQICKIL